jgi:hypothetical protein
MNDNKLDDSNNSPVYDTKGGNMYKSLSVAAVMMFLTIGGMLGVAGTQVAEIVPILYAIPVVGVLVFGGAISLGRYLGIKGVKENNNKMAVIGSAILVGAYSIFGGGIMAPFESDIYLPAILITGGITTLITLIAGTYVMSRDEDLSQWKSYAGLLFMGGIGASIVASFIQSAIIVAFALVTLGFVAELVYEIWESTQSNRPPLVNGIGIYVAFAGVFVHILQLVLRALSEQ